MWIGFCFILLMLNTAKTSFTYIQQYDNIHSYHCRNVKSYTEQGSNERVCIQFWNKNDYFIQFSSLICGQMLWNWIQIPLLELEFSYKLTLLQLSYDYEFYEWNNFRWFVHFSNGMLDLCKLNIHISQTLLINLLLMDTSDVWVLVSECEDAPTWILPSP